MSAGGFAGAVLEVDLTRGRVEIKPLDRAVAEKFLGGLGTCIKLASDRTPPGIDPLSPDNPVVLGAGPLVGTSLPATSRVYALTRLPASRTIGWAGGGGMNFGVNLKNAGFDHVIITGRADAPVYLEIEDHEVNIRDASGLWGKGVEESYNELVAGRDEPPGVISIGQAGERLVSFSMAYVDRFSTLGRGGLGAVLGSKNLKAVVVKGTRGIEVADRKAYRNLSGELMGRIREYPYLKEWQELGLVKSLPLVPRDVYRKIKKRRTACVSCPVGDKDVIEIPDGPFKGLVACSSSAVNLFTPMIFGISDYREAVRLSSALDEYGLDMFEFFGLVGFAKKLADQGIIPAEAAREEINPSSLESMLRWAEMISRREGLGDIMAGGIDAMIAEFGKPARELAPPSVKGMIPYVGPGAPLAWELFGTMELGQVLDPRGPHVGASGSPTYFARRPLEVFPKHLERMGVPKEAIERIIQNTADGEEGLKVGALLKYSHSWFTILGSLGICARAQINRFYNAELCANLYQAVTGIETDLPELRRRADRAWTLLRLANLKQGADREQDALPEKWFGKRGFKDYLTGEPARPADAEAMIEDYYREWGWDEKTGEPGPDLIEKLGLT